jgi:hypothetical protein
MKYFIYINKLWGVRGENFSGPKSPVKGAPVPVLSVYPQLNPQLADELIKKLMNLHRKSFDAHVSHFANSVGIEEVHKYSIDQKQQQS